MDGWETRRKRIAGHDWCIVKLGFEGRIAALHFDTAFFSGNQAPAVSVQAARLDDSLKLVRRSEMGTACTQEELKLANELGSESWDDILPIHQLKPGHPDTRHHVFRVSSPKSFTHLRVNIFPDGGIARMHVYGTVERDWSKHDTSQMIDLVRVDNGGRALRGFTDAHYGRPSNLIALGRAPTMKYGWETRRNPDRPAIFQVGPDGHLILPGKHACILRLGHVGRIDNVEVDTNWFKGNFPESVVIEGLNSTESDDAFADPWADKPWFTIVPRSKLSAHQQHIFTHIENSANPVSHLRITMFPDGGISRIRCNGFIC